MTTFVDLILMDVQLVEEKGLIEPQAEPGSGDHVVGTAGPELQKLYSLALTWEKAATEAILAARYSTTKVNLNQTAVKITQLREKAKILMEIFWISLKDAFNLWDKESVGIRKGWKVVWTNPQSPSIGDILGQIFGQ